MIVLALKILLAPLLIATATLAGRRWGPAVSGWFIGFPIISGPISITLAMQDGPNFAGQAAVGMFGGQTAMCIFAATYILAARKLNWWQSAILGVSAFIATVMIWRALALPLLPAFALLIGAIFVLSWLIPAQAVQIKGQVSPKWDLPARMVIAVIFVATLTGLSSVLGAQLSGLISAFPVFGTILASFTHSQQGGQAAGQLLRGTIVGSLGIASFYLVVSVFLPLTGSLWVYLPAAAASVVANVISIRFTRPRGA
ncbi:MAG TPA: hypothetical protein PKW33_02430 [Anaerolineaceae bacterium]|nr:hypothetical protein [Anaerolineaceae bacterium]HPN50417.1 hypothetical protein [Anaerolineaceae bacterium]